MDFDYSGGLSWEAKLFMLLAFIAFLLVVRVLIRIASLIIRPSADADRDHDEEWNRPAVLALGDLAAFLAFGALGLASHEDAITLKTVVRAVLVFPAAWFVIAPFFGAFSERAIVGREPLWRIAIIWLGAGVIALIARAAIFDRSLVNAFFVIALVGHGMLLLGWRAAYAAWSARSVSAPTG